MKVTWGRIIHPGPSAASLTFTHLELLTHEEYSPWKRMWLNLITVRSACLSHASRLLVPKWITVLLNRSQFACWHDWINSTKKQTSRSCPWTFPAECQLQTLTLKILPVMRLGGFSGSWLEIKNESVLLLIAKECLSHISTFPILLLHCWMIKTCEFG